MTIYWVVLLAIFKLAFALDPLGDFCRLHSHRTAVVDHKLYIDGGFVNWAPLGPSSANETSTWLRVADFDTSNAGFPQQSTLAKNETVPSVSGGILWPDTANKIIYAYGGEQDNRDEKDERFWYYDILYNTWNVSLSDTVTSVSPCAWGAGTTASDKALGYYYGGWLTNSSEADKMAVSTMLVYNMLENKFSTQSGPDQVSRAEGVMLYIPTGDAGILVYFGGIQIVNGTQQPLPMSEIFIYDIANTRWYKQTTSGAELPGSRRRFCAGAVWTEDRSSYNIYLYGGASIGQGIGYGDVWILSLPSFTWIKFFPGSDDNAVTIPHHSLSCDVYENSQMIIMGGHFTNSTDCDVPSAYGQHGLDLGRSNKEGLKWAAFNASMTTYNVPPEVTKAITSNSTNSATLTGPQNGWETGDLSVVFGRPYTPSIRAATRSLPTPTSNSTLAHERGPTVGAIAGIAVACVLIVLALGMCIFLVRRRRRRAQDLAPLEPRYHMAQPSHHVELPGTLARSYSASSINRFVTVASFSSPDTSTSTSHYASKPVTSPQQYSQESWVTANHQAASSHSPLVSGPSELDNVKERVLLTPIHELPAVRSPMEIGVSRISPRQSRFKEEE